MTLLKDDLVVRQKERRITFASPIHQDLTAQDDEVKSYNDSPGEIIQTAASDEPMQQSVQTMDHDSDSPDSGFVWSSDESEDQHLWPVGHDSHVAHGHRTTLPAVGRKDMANVVCDSLTHRVTMQKPLLTDVVQCRSKKLCKILVPILAPARTGR